MKPGWVNFMAMLVLASRLASAATVKVSRTPDDGIQPQAVADAAGIVHLMYFKGDPNGGDVFYVRREAGREEFSKPMRVNSQPGSVLAIGTIRGAQFAVGRGGRVHVAWMGSANAEPRGPLNAAPMLYARLNDAQTGFEPQRNVMQVATGLDGGGSVAADDAGHVYVAWHADAGAKSETGRRVWVARSSDDGKTFVRETPAFAEPTGACGCCGMRALADAAGNVHVLYRAATKEVNRDMWLLRSKNFGASFDGTLVQAWKLTSCPMSSASLAREGRSALLAWETDGQVFYAKVDAQSGKVLSSIPAPGAGSKRKHPVVAANAKGQTLLAWTEGTGWEKGGAAAWQVFDAAGQPTGERGRVEGVPTWSFAAAWARADGGFVIVY